MILHNVLLGIHVTVGSAGLLLGPVVMWQDSRGFIAKRRSTSRAGGAYRVVVLLVCLSAVALVIEHRPDLWWLIPVSALTYGLAVLARSSARRRHAYWLHGYVHGQGGSYIALWTALIVVALTVDGPVTGTAQLLPWLAPTAIGVILIEIWRRKLDRHLRDERPALAVLGEPPHDFVPVLLDRCPEPPESTVKQPHLGSRQLRLKLRASGRHGEAPDPSILQVAGDREEVALLQVLDRTMDGLLRYLQDGQQLADGDPRITPDEVEDPVVGSPEPAFGKDLVWQRGEGTVAEVQLLDGAAQRGLPSWVNHLDLPLARTHNYGNQIDLLSGPPAMFSNRIDGLRPSPIRAILNVIDRPGMVSFAGGLPATQALPRWSGTTAPETLQYGPSEGEPSLRAAVSGQLRRLGIDAPAERVMILSGSQQGIDLVAKLFIDPGTPTAVEFPTYLAALQVFRFYGARFVDVHAEHAAEARLAYVVPTFSNPTGSCATSAERDALARRCLSTGTTLFEDDPYRELAYDPCDRQPIAARMAGGSWVYQGSFSKTFAPGLRVGFLAASEDLYGPLAMLKQAVDLHSSRLSQHIVHDAITASDWTARLGELVTLYRARRDTFEEILGRHFNNLARWSKPSGGLFYWLRLHNEVDTRTMLDEAIARGVAFMPGEEFYPNEPQLGTMRLNFSHADAGEADRGLRVLAELIRERQS